jgi:methanol metabolism-related c-type cytochrome
VISNKKLFTVVLALSAGFAVAACNDEKVDAAKEKAKEMAGKIEDKVEAAKDKAKDAAAKLEDKIEEKVDAAKEKMKAMADKAKDAAQPAAKDAAAPAAAAVAAAPEAKPADAAPAEKKADAAPEAKPAEAAPAAAAPEVKPADAAPAPSAPAAAPAAAAPEEKKSEAAPAPAVAEEKKAEAAPAPAAAPAAGGGEDNAAVQAAAKEAGLEFKDNRYRDKDGHPFPAASKDYKVDWATWQGFRRYHDACHVCHGPNALGSTFAPSLAESLKTMDYETFYGTVVGGRIADRGGTKYVMPAFGEDKNIMCYIDDIYTYIKARSLNMEGKGGMPPGRPNGREDISPEAKKAASDCTG